MRTKSKSEQSSKVGIIAATSTPLRFLALIVLVIEAILGALALRVTGFDLTLLLIGMLVSLLLLIVAGIWLIGKESARLSSQAQTPVAEVSAEHAYKYDVFVSSPMAGHANDVEYQTSRQQAIEFETNLRTKCKFTTIYYAGHNIANTGDFEAEDISAEDVLEAIKQSKYFALVYLSKIVSSSLLETGCALALRKPSVFFVHNRDDIPFLMKKAEQAFPNIVKIYECHNMAAVIKLLEKHAERLFPSAKN